MTELILYALNAVGPIFLMVGAGYLFKKKHIIDDSFVRNANVLVFYFALPAYIFMSVANSDFRDLIDLRVIAAITLGTLVTFFIALALTAAEKKTLKGAFIQAATRSNATLLGLALIHNTLGESGAALGSSVLAVLIPLANILSLIVLLNWKQANLGRQIMVFVKNPLLIAIFLGIFFSLSRLTIPSLAYGLLELLARLSLPLALIGIGGSLKPRQAAVNKKALSLVVVLKNIMYPVVTVIFGWIFGLSTQAITVLFLISASPTAVSAYVMADATGNDADFTASAILTTTLAAVLTISAGLIILRIVL